MASDKATLNVGAGDACLNFVFYSWAVTIYINGEIDVSFGKRTSYRNSSFVGAEKMPRKKVLGVLLWFAINVI